MPKAEIPHTQNAYMIFQNPCVSDIPLIFLPIFLGKICLDTPIRLLNPECYDPGRKILIQMYDSQFAVIATWSSAFCCIQKSHMQLRIWNHACLFTCFPFFCWIRLTYSLYRVYGILATTYHLFKWCCRLKAVFIAVYWLHVLGNFKFYLYSESENGYG